MLRVKKRKGLNVDSKKVLVQDAVNVKVDVSTGVLPFCWSLLHPSVDDSYEVPGCTR